MMYYYDAVSMSEVVVPINQYSSNEFLDYINLFIVILSITQDMRCTMCKNLFLDCSKLLCGHSFCEYCLLRHLRILSICPMCQKNVSVHLSRRTYQIDSFLDYVHPQLQKILKLKTHRQYDSDYLLSRSQRFLNNASQASSPELRETVRAIRRDRLKRIKCPAVPFPFQSLLDHVVNVSHTMNQSAPGCFLAIFACVFFSFSIFYMCDLMQEIGLSWVRQFGFAVMTTCTLFGLFIHGNNAGEKSFWNRVVETKIRNLPQYQPSENDMILKHLNNGSFTLEEIREGTIQILDAIIAKSHQLSSES